MMHCIEQEPSLYTPKSIIIKLNVTVKKGEKEKRMIKKANTQLGSRRMTMKNIGL